MKRKFYRALVLLQIGLVACTGCQPLQPFFAYEDGDLSHYLATATQIEYPDLHVEQLPEATDVHEPLTIRNQNYEFRDMSLEDCVSIALANTKLVRALPGSSLQTGDIATTVLSSPSQQLTTDLDPALVSTSASPQPLVIDSTGNRTLPRGAARANQVGSVEDALSEFDAQYSSFFAYNTTDRPRNTGQNIFTPPEFVADDATYQAAISKRMATGGVVTARSQSIYSSNNVLAGPTSIARAFPSDYTQALEIQIQHPLMRNRGTLVNRIPVVLARLNEDTAIADYQEQIRNLVKEVEIAYWDLYLAYWNVETNRVARESSLQTWAVANDRAREGSQPAYLASLAEATVHRLEAQLDAAFGGASIPGADEGVVGRERTLRYLLGWGATDGFLIRPVDKPFVARVEFDWQNALGEAFTRNVDLRQQKWEVKKRQLELMSAKNQMLPDFNISGTYRWVGVGNTLLDASSSGQRFPFGEESAWQSLSSGDYQEFGGRLEFTPNAFGARRASLLVENAKKQLQREVLILQEKEIALSNRLTSAFQLLEGNFAQMERKLNEWNAQDNVVRGFSDRFEIGDGDLNTILDNLVRAQQSRASAQQEYYRSVVEYNKQIVMVHLLKGSLLEYNNIVLSEGPWPEKAYWDATERARERDAARFLPNGASRPEIQSQGPLEQHMGTVNQGIPTPIMNGQPTPLSGIPTPLNPGQAIPMEQVEGIPAPLQSGEGEPLPGQNDAAPADDSGATDRSTRNRGGSIRIGQNVSSNSSPWTSRIQTPGNRVSGNQVSGNATRPASVVRSRQPAPIVSAATYETSSRPANTANSLRR